MLVNAAYGLRFSGLLLPAGTSLIFSGAAVLSTAEVPPYRTGLAGGAMNTAMGLGPTVGLAALMSVAAAQTDTVTGYAWAFSTAASRLPGRRTRRTRAGPPQHPHHDMRSFMADRSQVQPQTVFPEESTRVTAPRSNSSVYGFAHLLPTWCYFLWNLRSQSQGVHDQGEASQVALPVPGTGRFCSAGGRNSTANAVAVPGGV